jgi:hypothetical protein
MASELLQYGLLKDPKQYMMIIQTGNLDAATEEDFKEQNLIVSENEMLLNGELPPVLDLDQHKQHILHHISVLADSRMRQNPELVQVTMQHIKDHLDALRNADPMLLGLFGEQSLAVQTPMDPNQAPGMLPEQPSAQNPGALPQPADQVARPPEPFNQAPMNSEELQQQII